VESIYRGPCDFDTTHAVKVYGIWTPHIFHVEGWKEKIIGGWSVSGIFNWHTGFPWSPTYNNIENQNTCKMVFTNAGCTNGSNSALLPAAYLGGTDGNHSNSPFGRPLQAGLALRPQWAEGWWSLGTLEYDRNNYAAAARTFQRRLALAPKNGTAHAMLGLSEFELGQDDNALKHTEEAQTLGVTNDTQLRRVVVFSCCEKTSLKARAIPSASCARRACRTIPLREPWAWLPCASVARILSRRLSGSGCRAARWPCRLHRSSEKI
jgi:tetratricopeptide (TPR) repeat protein